MTRPSKKPIHLDISIIHAFRQGAKAYRRGDKEASMLWTGIAFRMVEAAKVLDRFPRRQHKPKPLAPLPPAKPETKPARSRTR